MFDPGTVRRNKLAILHFDLTSEGLWAACEFHIALHGKQCKASPPPHSALASAITKQRINLGERSQAPVRAQNLRDGGVDGACPEMCAKSSDRSSALMCFI